MDSAQSSPTIYTSVFSKVKEGWSYSQELKITTDMTRAEVYEDTIAISSVADTGRAGGVYGKGTVNVFYPNTQAYAGPKWKPAPVQWSLQQVLISPIATSTDIASPTDTAFGTTLSLDGNRMFVGEVGAAKNGYIYERTSATGLWSVQQKIASTATLVESQLSGSHVVSAYAGGVDILDETQKWDCLVVSVEDHFNDGWDTAHLVVDVPGGEKDSFTSRCDETNPFQFRYCPASCSDEGLYKFSIPGGKAAKFHWEQVWRVYEEATGDWFTGNWDTKMDFEWNCAKRQFMHKKIERELPNNITCKACKSRPTEKPSSRLRHLKDSTVAPTISPAPTIATSVQIHPWQELRLIAGSSNDWFDSQHRGTSYYISTVDGKKLLSVGTMCPWERTLTYKTCWEDYPDGDYILRVGGALDRISTHTFKFCHGTNAVSKETQMIFRVTNGECTVLSSVKSSGYCGSRLGVAQVAAMEFSLTGIPNAVLSTSDFEVISDAVSSVLAGVSARDVRVVSAVSDGSGVSVTVEVTASSQTTGYDFSDAESVEAWEAATMSKVMSQEGMRAIRSALNSGEHASLLHSTTHVEVTRFQLTGSTEAETSSDGPDRVTNFADTLGLNAYSEETSDSQNQVMWVALAGYVVAGIGVIAIAAVTIRHLTASPKEVLAASDTVVSATTTTTVESNVPSQARSPTLTLADMKELVAAEESALELMLKNPRLT